MSNYEKVYKVWKNLNESYNKMGQGHDPLSFVQTLLMYSKGEAAFRDLLKRINDDPGDASPEQVEQLCNMLQTARSNVNYCKANNISEVDLNTFALQPITITFNVGEFFMELQPQEVLLEELLAEGSIIPIERCAFTGICKKYVQEYSHVCTSQADFIEYVSELSKNPQYKALLKILQHYAKEKAIQIPLVVTSHETVQRISESGFDCDVVKNTTTFSVEDITADLYCADDRFSKVTILGLN